MATRGGSWERAAVSRLSPLGGLRPTRVGRGHVRQAWGQLARVPGAFEGAPPLH